MKTKIFTILWCIVALFTTTLNAQNLDLIWAKKLGGATSADGSQTFSVKIDATGNVYTIGNFGGTVDFDPNSGVANLTSAGSSDVFVSKLDANGNFVWAKNMGGTNDDVGRSLFVDATNNVYATGYFQGIADFDPNAGVANLTSAGSFDIFVSKLDANGNFVWAKAMGGTGADGLPHFL